MDNKIFLDHADVTAFVQHMAHDIQSEVRTHKPRLFPVPRGGIPVAYLLLALLPGSRIVEKPEEADVIIDDLIDSGATRDRFPGKHFKALFNKQEPKYSGKWIVFPWEVGQEDQSADDIVVRLLQYIGESPDREGLKETPQRVLKAWKHWTSGYGEDPLKVLKCFRDGGEKYDEMVLQKEAPFYSTCEHHLAPFFGTATIAYIPDEKVVGLSKLQRVLNIFARRLQVQERMTVQIADAIQEVLKPKGVGVLLKARHLCMESRGVAVQGQYTVTSALRGKFLDDATVRAEFLAIAK